MTRLRERVNAAQPVAYVAVPPWRALRFWVPAWAMSWTMRLWRSRWRSISTRTSGAVRCTMRQSRGEDAWEGALWAPAGGGPCGGGGGGGCGGAPWAVVPALAELWFASEREGAGAARAAAAMLMRCCRRPCQLSWASAVGR